jgi:hypothetical protein
MLDLSFGLCGVRVTSAQASRTREVGPARNGPSVCDSAASAECDVGVAVPVSPEMGEVGRDYLLMLELGSVWAQFLILCYASPKSGP